MTHANVKILVCCHKKDIMATEAPYFPIHVGKALSDKDLSIQPDNEGENINEWTKKTQCWDSLKIKANGTNCFTTHIIRLIFTII